MLPGHEHPDRPSVGLNELQQQYDEQYGPGYYIPNVFIQYWSHARDGLFGQPGLAAFCGRPLVASAVAKLLTSRLFLWLATAAVVTPFVMNTAGWMLTENGRQPWIVQGLMLTEDGVSASVSATDLIISLSVFGAVYLLLTALWIVLLRRYAKKGLPEETASDKSAQDEVAALTY